LVTKEAIDSALTAHAAWKKRLQDAIDKGTSEFKVEVVEKDNVCQFGQWLYSLQEDDTFTQDYAKAKDLHAEFHKTAASVLEKAINGSKEEALKIMEFGGGYGKITGKLVIALNEWKSKL
jgi:hypothetical protein